ncbi:MAG: trigger factor [Pseudomonadota bacterium]
MQVTETRAEGLSREYTVKVDLEELDRRLTAKLEELKGQVRLKGFRPGKAPVSFLKKMYGKGVMGEIIQDLMTETSEKALSERSLKPAMQPKIDLTADSERLVAGEADLEYTMSVEVMPEFEPIDPASLTLERKTTEVSDADLDEALDRLAEQQRSYEAREDGAAAEEGDALTIDFVGKIDGEPFDGGTGDDVRLVIGSGGFIPGFEEQLKGVKAGESRVVSVTFPEDYGVETLKGKDAEFDVKVGEVAAPKEAAIDDELAKKLGLEDLNALKENVKERLAADFGQLSRQHVKRALLDALDDAHDFDLPEGMVDAEFQEIWRQVQAEMKAGADAAADGEGDEASDEEEPDEDEYRQIARRRVRLGLVLAEIGQRNNVTVPQEDLSRAIAAQARQMPGQEQIVYDFYRNNPGALAQLRAPIFEDKVVDYILELATVTDKPVSKEELMKDPEGDDEAAS